MGNLYFAFEAVAPIFTIMLIGVGLRKIGLISKDLIQQGNCLCFQFLFPVLVFLNLYDAQDIDVRYLKIIAYIIGVIFISLFCLWFIVKKTVKDRKQHAVVIQSTYRANFMLYALPFSKILGGTECAALATSVMAATLPILNILGVLVYSFCAGEEQKPDLKKALINALKNPIIWGVVLGLLFHGLRIKIPGFLHSATSDVAKIATPLAFMLLGAQTEFSSAKKNLKVLAWGIFGKLIVMPVVFIPIAIKLLHVSGIELIPIFIFLAAPTAITNYQMAIQYDADQELAGDFLIYTMIFSAFTIFFFIFVLKSRGLI